MNSDVLTHNLRSIVHPKQLQKPVAIGLALKALDDYCKQDAGIHPRLKHYLQQRSYAKALDWLDNPDMPHQP